jgi:hypothetical protein
MLLAFVRAHVGEPVRVEPIAGEHEDADVWRIEHADGLRAYLKRPHHAGLMARERSAYRALAPVLADAIPRLIACCEPPHAALLLSEVPGLPISDAALSPGDELEVHRQLGALRRQMDAAPVTHDPVDPAEAVARRFRHWCVRGAATIDDAAIERIGEAFDPAPLRGMARRWCHRDLGLHNLRIDIDGERERLRVHILDLGRARPDVWLADLVELSLGPWSARAELAHAFFGGYGRELSSRERDGLRALSLVHALATAVWGDAHGDAARSGRGRLQLDRLLR